MSWVYSWSVIKRTGVVLLLAGIVVVVILAALGMFSASSRSSVPITTHVRPTVPDVTVARPAFQACAHPPCFNVGNTCPFPIWIHAVNNPASGSPVTLTPDLQELQPGEALQLDVPADWPSGRVSAYYKDPTAFPQAFDKVEMTVTSNGRINYDLTYVDYVALPSSLWAGPGADCGTGPTYVECVAKVQDILSGCPSGAGFSLLDEDNRRCLSAGLFCSDPANANNPFCHLLDSTLAQCVANVNNQYPNCNLGAGNTTANVYSCSGYFDGQPSEGHTDGNKWCAALNRNMLSAPDSTDANLFFQTAPYNQYAKWMSTTCPGTYNFAYADYPPGAQQSGDRDCATERLDILWCPGNAA